MTESPTPEDLKPDFVMAACPFCGGEGRLDEWSFGARNVYCAGCSMRTQVAASEAKAIAAWNTRPPSTEALRVEIERLRAALKPFADAYDFWNAADGGVHDDTEIDDQGKITIADCREARALLPNGGSDEG